MDDFDLYLDANLTMYGYWSTKISLCMVKDQPKGGGRSYIILYIIWHIIWHIYIYIILYKMRETFFFKTVALGTKIAFSRLYLACATIFDRFEIILIYSEMLWDKRISFDKISIHNKNSRKKVLRAWIPFQCCFTAYLTVRRIFMANPHGCFPRSYTLKTQFIDFLI
jgi:hypothetical protein